MQILSLPPLLTQAKLSGILHVGTKQEASFSGVNSVSTRPRKQRLFQEGDEIEAGITLAQISNDWVLLQQGQNMQLLLLRDSLNRVSPTPTPAPLPASLPELPGQGESLNTAQTAQKLRKMRFRRLCKPLIR